MPPLRLCLFSLLFCLCTGLLIPPAFGEGQAPLAEPPASPAYLPSNLSQADLLPQFRAPRAYLESYGFWVLDAAQKPLFISILYSNLAGGGTAPAISLTRLTGPGQGYRVAIQGDVDDVQAATPGQSTPLSLRIGDSHFTGDGHIYTLKIDGQAQFFGPEGPTGRSASFKADLRLMGESPPYAFGKPMPVGSEAFYLAHLFTQGRAEGFLTVGSEVTPLKGKAYGDHSWQTAWAQDIAHRWVNFRLFMGDRILAASTWVAPSGQAFGRAALADSQGILAISDQITVDFTPGGAVDPKTGYEIPTGLSVDMGALGQISTPLGLVMDSQDLMADVNAVLRQVLHWWVAKPHTYRFVVPGVSFSSSGSLASSLSDSSPSSGSLASSLSGSSSLSGLASSGAFSSEGVLVVEVVYVK